MKPGSNDFQDYARNVGRVSWTSESEAEEMARSLLVLERQRRIYDRLAAFERELEERAARVVGQPTS